MAINVFTIFFSFFQFFKDTFARRHIGPRDEDIKEMLEVVGFKSLDELSDAIVPEGVRYEGEIEFDGLSENGMGEREALEKLRATLRQNKWQIKSMLGQGFYGTEVPGVIQRNLLENPAWYTAYTPYQAEISQGRMEMLLNYQTMVCDMTGMKMANASLLCEGTAAAEALSMCLATHATGVPAYFVDEECHPATIEVVKSRSLAVKVPFFSSHCLSVCLSDCLLHCL